MATLIAQGICCCFACCCKDISDALSRLLGPERVTKVYYLFLVLVFTIPGIAALFYIHKIQWLLKNFSWLNCPANTGDQFDCIGPSTIFRISLSFLVLFLLMLCITICRNRLAMVVNEGLFCVKYLLVLGIFISLLFVNNSLFIEYADASKYISVFFMLIQAIILIDLFYLAGIKLVSRYDQGENCCALTLIVLTLICEAAAITLNVLGYVYFSEEDQCGNSNWVNIIASIMIAVLPIVQIFNFNKQNSLLTTSMVSTYVSYLSFICQFSYGQENCTARMNTRSLATDIIISTFFFTLTMYGSIMGGTGQVKVTQDGSLNQAMGVAVNQQESVDSQQNDAVPLQQPLKQNQQNEASNQVKYSESWAWPKWHFYMCLASIYVGMLITNWTSANITTGQLSASSFGFWVRVALAWATTILYIWTLVAPKVFPERDFVVV